MVLVAALFQQLEYHSHHVSRIKPSTPQRSLSLLGLVVCHFALSQSHGVYTWSGWSLRYLYRIVGTVFSSHSSLF